MIRYFILSLAICTSFAHGMTATQRLRQALVSSDDESSGAVVVAPSKSRCNRSYCIPIGAAVTSLVVLGAVSGAGTVLIKRLFGGVGQMEAACDQMQDACTVTSAEIAELMPTFQLIQNISTTVSAMLKGCPRGAYFLYEAFQGFLYTCCSNMDKQELLNMMQKLMEHVRNNGTAYLS